METPPDSSGQRLRWWQEDAPVTQKWYTEPAVEPSVAVSTPVESQPLSFEEELELEALRRANLERDTVLVEGTYANTAAKTRRSLAWTLGPVGLANLAIGVLGQSWQNAVIPLLFLAEYFLIMAIVRRQFARSKPQIAISSLGLTVDLPYHRIGPIFWDEVASVRVVNFWFTRYVSVKLKDTKTLQRAFTPKSGVIGWLNSFTLGKKHIEIQDQWFTESAQEIAAKITTFRPQSASDDNK